MRPGHPGHAQSPERRAPFVTTPDQSTDEQRIAECYLHVLDHLSRCADGVDGRPAGAGRARGRSDAGCQRGRDRGAAASARGVASAGVPTYPFTAPNGTTVGRQVFGPRTFDLNTDGVAQYGLYAGWTTDLLRQAGGDAGALRSQLMNGAEAYTRMWERAGTGGPDR